MRGEALGAEGPISHPSHYTSHPSKIECITIVEHMNFCLGNAVKYIWRAGLKNPEGAFGPTEDLKKAVWYLEREIARLEGSGGRRPGEGQ